MWHIENPWKVFDHIYLRNEQADFNFMSIINTDKWITFDNRDKILELQEICSALRINDVKIRDPDNPAKLNEAKLVSFYF